MQEQDIGALIGKTAALMEQFERRCADIESRQQSLTHTWQHLAEQIPAAVRESADQSLQRLPRDVLGKVEHGLEQPVCSYQKRLQEAGGLLGDGSRTLAGQIQRLEKRHRHLVWKTVAAVAGSLALVLAGAIWRAPSGCRCTTPRWCDRTVWLPIWCRGTTASMSAAAATGSVRTWT